MLRTVTAEPSRRPEGSAEPGTALAEHRRGRTQQPPDDPVVKVGNRVRAFDAHRPVGRSAAHKGVQLEGELGIVEHSPEIGRLPVVERLDQQFQLGPAAQRRTPAEQAAHNGERAAAQDQPDLS